MVGRLWLRKAYSSSHSCEDSKANGFETPGYIHAVDLPSCIQERPCLWSEIWILDFPSRQRAKRQQLDTGMVRDFSLHHRMQMSSEAPPSLTPGMRYQGMKLTTWVHNFPYVQLYVGPCLREMWYESENWITLAQDGWESVLNFQTL